MYECKISEKLVELRTLKGVTQDDVAQALSVSNKTISKWETGASMPDLSMLVDISRYYGVTTDFLLGLSDGEKNSTKEEVYSSFKGLDRKESVFKAFETVKSIIPAIFGTVAGHDDANDKSEVFPVESQRYSRSLISVREFFEFVANSENVNVAVMMLRNKADFGWMKEPDKQRKIVKLFKLLSDEEVLSLIYFIHSTSCSESFTADYIVKNTGAAEEKVCKILDELCSLGVCNCSTAYLVEGEVKVYESFGDGLILSLVTIAFERMCGKQSYDYCFSGRCKMIGGK